MSKNLPPEKIDKLADDCAKDIERVAQDHYDRARRHEVSRDDAEQIVVHGFKKAAKTPLKDFDAACPDKPRK